MKVHYIVIAVAQKHFYTYILLNHVVDISLVSIDPLGGAADQVIKVFLHQTH